MSQNNNIFKSISEKPMTVLLVSLLAAAFLIFYGDLSSHNPGIEATDVVKKANAYITTAQGLQDQKEKGVLLEKAFNELYSIDYRKFPHWYTSRAYAYLVSGRVDSAYVDLKRAQDFNRDQQTATREINNFMNYATTQLAIAYINNGINDNAYRIAVEGLQVNPKNAELYNVIGIYYTRQSKLDSALASFQKANEVQPGHKGALTNIRNLFVGQAQKGFKENDMNKAISMLWNAEKIAPKDAQILLMLGQAHINVGDMKMASYYLNKVLEVDPNNANAKNLLRRIGR